MTEYDFDLVVIGSGPAGQRAAIQAAKLGKHVAIAERRAVVSAVHGAFLVRLAEQQSE